MKYPEAPLLLPSRAQECAALGVKLTRLRQARHMRQADAASRAGLSRSTAVLIEQGDPGRTLAQVLRYLEAIAPGLGLLGLLTDTDPALKALAQTEATRRVRPLSPQQLAELDI